MQLPAKIHKDSVCVLCSLYNAASVTRREIFALYCK